MQFDPPAPSRSPWQLLYGAGHRLRAGWWRSRAEELPRPVISVGNLHWGGTSKTPVVAAIAEHLRDSQLEVAVLSRGYHSKGRGVRIISSGEGPLLGPLVGGDEPVLLAGQLPGVSVVVGPDRYRAGMHALERLNRPPDVFVLDDGFSHLRLHRDLDVLVFPASDPYGGGRLFPSGRLREPLASLTRAHAVLLTGSRLGLGAAFAATLTQYGFRGPGFASPTQPLPAETEEGRRLPPGSRVLLVTGIARPERVATFAEQAGFEIVDRLRFSDHHLYPAASLRRIEKVWLDSGSDCVLTTAKDAVKLRGRLDVPMASLGVRTQPEPAFWEWLNRALEPLLVR